MSEGKAGMPALAEAFWTHAVALYGRDEVAASCLRLQDRDGLEVNLLLFCCFAAALGLPPLERPALKSMALALAPWQKGMVVPLRHLRRGMRPGGQGLAVRLDLPAAQAAELREGLIEAELAAEKVAQSLICRAYLPAGTGEVASAFLGPEAIRARAAANLARYAGLSARRGSRGMDPAARKARRAEREADLARLAAAAG